MNDLKIAICGDDVLIGFKEDVPYLVYLQLILKNISE